ncbi:hypothetical protein GALMADRAFT_222663 [Galerina marginata CBS 339.88]|uniref:Uncharacterized protein n=1 Tax=Galerina marginata (strain CBS 339.88) TaxID=685588 RepID=A0A067TD87_GALM3|nr:hypothetical protein GALMADRAFT_222663 [Galerina marginata CBS 339.88]
MIKKDGFCDDEPGRTNYWVAYLITEQGLGPVSWWLESRMEHEEHGEGDKMDRD